MRMVVFGIGEMLITTHDEWCQGAKKCLSRLSDADVELGLISNTGTSLATS